MRAIFLALLAVFFGVSPVAAQTVIHVSWSKESEAHRRSGSTLHQKHEYDKAILNFSKAIRSDPNNSLAYHQRGFSWLAKSEYERAIKDFTEAIEVAQVNHHATPSQLSSYYGARGNAWIVVKEYDKAIDDLDRSMHLDPQNALASRFHAKALSKRNEQAAVAADQLELVKK